MIFLLWVSEFSSDILFSIGAKLLAVRNTFCEKSKTSKSPTTFSSKNVEMLCLLSAHTLMMSCFSVRKMPMSIDSSVFISLIHIPLVSLLEIFIFR